ncbi:hypothetical protein ACFP8Z_01670, partial [Gemmobacter lanyuensis]|uniref:hypothetical protein n=1 Tax=Gemmobacter lanyuensis TaxID=1054497 RepID=UPI0036106AFF
IEANDGRADEVKRPVGGSLRPSARHPREQAKSCFPAGIFIENRGSPRSSASFATQLIHRLGQFSAA